MTFQPGPLGLTHKGTMITEMAEGGQAGALGVQLYHAARHA